MNKNDDDYPSACPLGPGRTTVMLLLTVLGILCFSPPIHAQQKPLLRWGADISGGEPYVIENKGREPLGFEGELARYIADKIGRQSKFVQGSWDQLPRVLLERKDIDIILNGYEWSVERAKAMRSSIPYYFYRLRLIVPTNSKIYDWNDLKPGMQVGVLKDSAADVFLQRHYPQVKIVALGDEGTTTVMRMVADGNLDATVQDDPVVSWYMKHKKAFPTLRTAGDAVPAKKNSYYVIYTRHEDAELCDQINKAIRDGLKDGSLRRIYSKYDLWPDEDGDLEKIAQTWPPSGEEDELSETIGKPDLWRFVADLAYASLITIALTFIAMPLAMLIGLTVALGRLYGPSWLGALMVVYVEVIRGTPVFFQLMVIYFFLPHVGIILLPFWAGVVGLAINYGAYEAENYRAGLLAIPEGQTEAALALGMSRTTTLRRIIIPQAIRLVIPPVTNDFIALFKDTSICSAIAVTELLSRYRTLTINFPSMAVYTLMITAALYLLMSYPLSLLARYLEGKQEEEEDEAA